MSRIEAYVVLKSPIDLGLVSPSARRRFTPKGTPLEEALRNCKVVDKDDVQARIDQTLEEIDAVFRLGGLSRRNRAKIIARHEKTILEAPPTQQLTIMGSLRKQFDLDHNKK